MNERAFRNTAGRYREVHRKETNGTTYRFMVQKSNGPAMTRWQQVSINVRALTLKVTCLPLCTSTIDVFRLFEDQGNIASIVCPFGKGHAYVTFDPLPIRSFWETTGYHHFTEGQPIQKIRIELATRHYIEQIASPVNPAALRLERVTVNAKSLDFGVNITESSVMIMHSTDSSHTQIIRLMLNLRRKELVVDFPIEDEQYRFRVPFVHFNFLQEHEVDNGNIALFLSLPSPPEFLRKTKDIFLTHDPLSDRWNEKSAWFRMTKIVRRGERSNSNPLSLRNDDCLVDLGRWTSYRFVMTKSSRDELCHVLADYNVSLQTINSESTVPRNEVITRQLDDRMRTNVGGSSLLSYLDAEDVNLEFGLRYQLEVCISQGVLNEANLTKAFYENLSRMEPAQAQSLLEITADKHRRIYDPMSIFTSTIQTASRVNIPRYCALQRSATITPTTIHFSTPSVETSNRIIRQYREMEDRFLRVRFADEKGLGQIRSVEDNTYQDVYMRIKRAMESGIILGNRHYEFLAFGNSQFREHGAYFFASTSWLSAADMRKDMGNLESVNIIAKWASKLGLNFSTTRAINSTKVQVVTGADIERNGYCFTDGVGKISLFLGQMIASEFGLPESVRMMPSVYQFRLGGCKGVLAVDPALPAREIMIRASQHKFIARHEGLEIIRASSFATATLNRQLITVLSTLGVSDGTFLNMVRRELLELTGAMLNEQKAIEMLTTNVDMNQSTLKIASMLIDGFMTTQDPFTMAVLHLWRAWNVKLLKEKARVAVRKGAFLLGCIDETATLKGYKAETQDDINASLEWRMVKLPEIFLQIDHGPQKKNSIIEGICILARNPSLHPGDIRVVRAVDVPALHHLKNVVVLPQKGDRPLSNMCSGGDLDGDDYFVSWDPHLLPSDWNVPAMDYTAPPPTTINRQVTIVDAIDFFVTYMKYDRLPQIAHAHLAISDMSARGVNDQKCLELAQLHSDAVDYPKSGRPAVVGRHLRVHRWPHFMEKKHLPADKIYHSKGILGKLYDEVQLIDFEPQLKKAFDDRILCAYNLDDTILDAAAKVKQDYDTAMRRIMAQHGIRSEFEVWSGFVLEHNLESKDYKFAEDIGRAMNHLKDSFRQACIEKAGGRDFNQVGPFVAALYTVTARQVNDASMRDQQMPLISMPWIFVPEMGKIATKRRSGINICHFRQF